MHCAIYYCMGVDARDWAEVVTFYSNALNACLSIPYQFVCLDKKAWISSQLLKKFETVCRLNCTNYCYKVEWSFTSDSFGFCQITERIVYIFNSEVTFIKFWILKKKIIFATALFWLQFIQNIIAILGFF